MSAYDWMSEALCAQTDPDLFHPEGSGSGYREAKKICAACPVQRECGEHAAAIEGDFSHRGRHGLWGAELPRKRADRAAANARAERDALIVRLTRQGGRTVAEVAEMAGCDARTVHRVTAAHRAKYGPAA